MPLMNGSSTSFERKAERERVKGLRETAAKKRTASAATGAQIADIVGTVLFQMPLFWKTLGLHAAQFRSGIPRLKYTAVETLVTVRMLGRACRALRVTDAVFERTVLGALRGLVVQQTWGVRHLALRRDSMLHAQELCGDRVSVHRLSLGAVFVAAEMQYGPGLAALRRGVAKRMLARTKARAARARRVALRRDAEHLEFLRLVHVERDLDKAARRARRAAARALCAGSDSAAAAAEVIVID